MKKISFRKKIKPCILSKEDLLQLAQIAYSFWKEEIAVAEKEWESKKLPELVERIQDHNKALKEGKISYFSHTSLPIEDPSPIIEKEKKYFIHTHKGFYEWRSSFKLYFKDKTITANSPDILGEELDTGKIRFVEFEVNSVEGNNKIKILISQVNGNSYYEVEGEDESWVRTIKDKLNDIFNDKQVSNGWLHKDSFKIPMGFLLAVLTLFTIFTSLKKIAFYNDNFSNPIFLWGSVFAGILIFIFLLRVFLSSLENRFPYLQLERSSSITPKEGFIGLVALGVITNATYELIRWIYN